MKILSYLDISYMIFIQLEKTIEIQNVSFLVESTCGSIPVLTEILKSM
jgi:hypothetical protein